MCFYKKNIVKKRRDIIAFVHYYTILFNILFLAEYTSVSDKFERFILWLFP